MGVGKVSERRAALTEHDVKTIVSVLLHLLEVAGSELGMPQLAAAIASLEALMGAFDAVREKE